MALVVALVLILSTTGKLLLCVPLPDHDDVIICCMVYTWVSGAQLGGVASV